MSRRPIWDRLESPNELVRRCGGCGGVSSLVTEGDVEQLFERVIEYLKVQLNSSENLIGDLADLAMALPAFHNEACSVLCECNESEWWRYERVRFGPGAKRRRRRDTSTDNALPKSQPGAFWLYRIWAHDDRLVYVGVTRNLQARMRRHRETYGEAVHRVTYEQHSSREAVLEAERVAIANEHPAFNLEGL